MNVYSTRPVLVGLALYTVTDDHRDCVQRVALGRPIPAVNRKLVAKCKIQPRGAAVIDCKARYSLRIDILAYPTCIRGPCFGGSRWNIAMPFGTEKIEWWGYPMVKKFGDMFIRFYMIYKLDRHRDTQTLHDGKGRT